MPPDTDVSANQSPESLGILILAAGNSSRFGSCKLLAECLGQPLISHSLRAALAFPQAQVQVVTGAWHGELEAAMASGKLPAVSLLLNRDWASGMGSSVALGVRSMAQSCRQILILLADQPLITPQDCQQLLNADSRADICCAAYAGGGGVPALFRSDTFTALMQLDGQKGAKALFRNPSFRVVKVAMPQAARDIDYPQDLNSLI